MHEYLTSNKNNSLNVKDRSERINIYKSSLIVKRFTFLSLPKSA